MSAAMLYMATSAAGIRPQSRVGVGSGFQGGESALSLGYQRAISDRATVTFGGAFSSDDSSVGVGAGFGCEGLGGGHGNPGWAGRESSRNDGRSVGSIHDPEEEFRRDQEAEPSHQCACRRRAVDDGRRCRPRRRVADP
ncbi:hypothetical protein G6F59_016471 [Rhizopus arrhizus]|nr:hypothetical protein G6F59_016471 [Rhizopus arrhizus]